LISSTTFWISARMDDLGAISADRRRGCSDYAPTTQWAPLRVNISGDAKRAICGRAQ
jgi:hypothetical protein